MRQIYGAVNSTDSIVPNVKLAIPDLTLVIQALEKFQGFSINIKECAITLYASELALLYGWQQLTAELHVYAIALQTDKEAA